jgi:hypothetical protein
MVRKAIQNKWKTTQTNAACGATPHQPPATKKILFFFFWCVKAVERCARRPRGRRFHGITNMCRQCNTVGAGTWPTRCRSPRKKKQKRFFFFHFFGCKVQQRARRRERASRERIDQIRFRLIQLHNDQHRSTPLASPRQRAKRKKKKKIMIFFLGRGVGRGEIATNKKIEYESNYGERPLLGCRRNCQQSNKSGNHR